MAEQSKYCIQGEWKKFLKNYWLTSYAKIFDQGAFFSIIKLIFTSFTYSIIKLKLVNHNVSNVDHASTGKNLFMKDTYWHNQLENLLKKYWEKIILTQSIEKSFLIKPLTINNAIYCGLLTLSS